MPRSAGHPRVIFLCGMTKYRSNKNRMAEMVRAVVELYRLKNGLVLFTEYAEASKHGLLVQRAGHRMADGERLEKYRVEHRLLRDLCRAHTKNDLIVVTNFWDYQKPLKELDPELPGNSLGIIYFDLETQQEVLQPTPKDPRLRDALSALAESETRIGHRLIVKKPVKGELTWAPKNSGS